MKEEEIYLNAIEFAKHCYEIEERKFHSFPTRVGAVFAIMLTVLSLVLGNFEYEKFMSAYEYNIEYLCMFNCIIVVFILSIIGLIVSIIFLIMSVKQQKLETLDVFSDENMRKYTDLTKDKKNIAFLKKILSDYNTAYSSFDKATLKRLKNFKFGLYFCLFSLISVIIVFVVLEVLINKG